MSAQGQHFIYAAADAGRQSDTAAGETTAVQRIPNQLKRWPLTVIVKRWVAKFSGQIAGDRNHAVAPEPAQCQLGMVGNIPAQFGRSNILGITQFAFWQASVVL